MYDDLVGNALSRGLAVPRGGESAAARKVLIDALVKSDVRAAQPAPPPRSGPPCSRARDWTLDEGHVRCLKYYIEKTAQRSGLAMRCDDFLRGVRMFFGRQPIGRHLDDPGHLDSIRNVARKDIHTINLCELNATCYQFVFETRAGATRVWQSFIDQSPGEGFSAREFAAAQPQPHWSPAVRAAHAARGGGRELGESELDALLKLLADLQAAAVAVGNAGFRALPADVISAEEAYFARIRANPPRGPFVVEAPSMLLLEPIMRAPNFPSNLSYYGNSFDGVFIFTNENHVGTHLQIRIEEDAAQPFMTLFRELTGHEPGASTYLNLILKRLFEFSPQRDMEWGIHSVIIKS